MFKSRSRKANRAAERQRARQGGVVPAAPGSREVIRDKSTDNTPHHRPETVRFPEPEPERTEVVSWGRRGYGIVFHPVPYVFGNPDAAHVDWLGLTFTPPDGCGIEWVFDQVRKLTRLAVTTHRATGWNGYTQSALLGDFGFIAWGDRIEAVRAAARLGTARDTAAANRVPAESRLASTQTDVAQQTADRTRGHLGRYFDAADNELGTKLNAGRLALEQSKIAVDDFPRLVQQARTRNALSDVQTADMLQAGFLHALQVGDKNVALKYAQGVADSGI